MSECGSGQWVRLDCLDLTFFSFEPFLFGCPACGQHFVGYDAAKKIFLSLLYIWDTAENESRDEKTSTTTIITTTYYYGSSFVFFGGGKGADHWDGEALLAMAFFCSALACFSDGFSFFLWTNTPTFLHYCYYYYSYADNRDRSRYRILIISDLRIERWIESRIMCTNGCEKKRDKNQDVLMFIVCALQ